MSQKKATTIEQLEEITAEAAATVAARAPVDKATLADLLNPDAMDVTGVVLFRRALEAMDYEQYAALLGAIWAIKNQDNDRAVLATKDEIKTQAFALVSGVKASRLEELGDLVEKLVDSIQPAPPPRFEIRALEKNDIAAKGVTLLAPGTVTTIADLFTLSNPSSVRYVIRRLDPTGEELDGEKIPAGSSSS